MNCKFTLIQDHLCYIGRKIKTFGMVPLAKILHSISNDETQQTECCRDLQRFKPTKPNKQKGTAKITKEIVPTQRVPIQNVQVINKPTQTLYSIQ